jgi:hypothetical protein
MPCCGKMRRQVAATFAPAFTPALDSSRPQSAEFRRPVGRSSKFPMGTVYFEYVGVTAITAVGTATGRQYRFPAPGVPVAVDARDRWSLAKVPNLREIRQ